MKPRTSTVQARLFLTHEFAPSISIRSSFYWSKESSPPTLPNLSGSFPPGMARHCQTRKRTTRRSQGHAAANLAPVLPEYLDRNTTHKSELTSKSRSSDFWTIPTRTNLVQLTKASLVDFHYAPQATPICSGMSVLTIYILFHQKRCKMIPFESGSQYNFQVLAGSTKYCSFLNLPHILTNARNYVSTM